MLRANDPPFSPDYTELARVKYGLCQAAYPTPMAFKQVGVGETLGWELVKRGDLQVIRLTSRKGVVPAWSIAKLLEERERLAMKPRDMPLSLTARKARARKMAVHQR
jgi:hypothetical protein